MKIITIQLSGMHTASCEEFSQSVDNKRGPVISDLCRNLALGNADLSRPVEVYRDGTLCFSNMTLKDWCRKTISEPDSTTIKETKWVASDFGSDEKRELAKLVWAD